MAQDDSTITIAEHEGAADEGHATARVVAELDGCCLYQGIPHREDRDREALAQANAAEDADAECADEQGEHARAKADAFAKNPRCAAEHCQQIIDDPARATFFPDVQRLAHRGECTTAVLQRLWGRITRVRMPRGRVV